MAVRPYTWKISPERQAELFKQRSENMMRGKALAEQRAAGTKPVPLTKDPTR